MSMIKINCWPWACAFVQCAMFDIPTCTIQIAQSEVNTSWMVRYGVYHNRNATNGSFPSLCDITGHYQKLIEFIEKSSIHQCPPYTSIEIYVSADKSMINPQFQTGVRNMKKWKKFTWCWLISLNKQQSVTKNISTHGIHKKPLTRLTGTSDKERPVFCWDPT